MNQGRTTKDMSTVMNLHEKHFILEKGMLQRKCIIGVNGIIILMAVMICFGLAGNVSAKSGKIVGKIVDKATGEPLIGASVQVVGTNLGAAANVDGDFVVNRVPEGTYTLMVFSIGYVKTEIDDVKIESDGSLELNVTLQSSVQETGTKIKVTARALQNTEANLLRARAKSPGISDAISAQAMSRAGAGDAAAAVERVTGASSDGGKVYIRGLGGRYGNSTLNGALIPTPDPEGNSVQMDLFQSNLLDNIRVEKTFTPDKAGNFSGGSVDLRTKELPEQMTLSFSSSVKYNTEASLNDNFLAAPRSRTDWIGIDDGMRDVPGLIEEYYNTDSLSMPNLSNAQGNPATAERLDDLSNQFTSTMNPKKRRSPLDQSYAFSFGNSYNAFDRPLGILASLTYNSSYKYYDDGLTGRYTLTGLNASSLDKDYLLQDTRGTEKVSWGGLIAANYSLHQNHKLSTRFLYTREAEQSAEYILGEVQKDQIVLEDGKLYETRNIKYVEQEVKSLQLNGEHFFKPFKIEWQGSVTSSGRDEPDIRDFSNEIAVTAANDDSENTMVFSDTEGDTTLAVLAYNMNGNLYPMPSHYYREISEDNYEGRLDVEFPLTKLNGSDLKLKMGASYLENSRDVREQYYKFRLGTTIQNWNGDPDFYFSDDWLGIIEFDSTVSYDAVFGWYYYDWNNDGTVDDSLQVDIYTGEVDTVRVDTTVDYNITFGSYIAEETSESNNYVGEQRVRAGYLMTDFNVLPKLRFVGGVRLENTQMSLSGNAESIDTLKGDLIYENDYLPSASLTYSVTDEMNLRLAYGKTLARPTIRELSPMTTYDFVKGYIYIGNTSLDRTLIDNYDFRWEWFTGPGKILAVSGFYKKFKNPIERTIINNNNNVKYKNVDKASVYGIEFEARENLGTLLPSLGNFNIEGNLALINSEVALSEFELNNRRYFDSAASDTRPLQGQSKYIVNLNLNYNNFRSGTDITLLYNIFGERLTEVSEGGTPDVYEQARPDLDLNLSQRIFSGLRFKASVKNILDNDVEKVIHFKGNDYIVAKYSRGISFSVGLSYSL